MFFYRKCTRVNIISFMCNIIYSVLMRVILYNPHVSIYAYIYNIHILCVMYNVSLR